MFDFIDTGLKEECGVFAVANVENASSITYFGLHAIQHRGQDACGIASSDGKVIKIKKDKGVLTEVFNNDDIKYLTGNISLGHVRYGTSGGDEIENVQPIRVRSYQGDFLVAHNGNIVNAKELRRSLEEDGSIFMGTGDSEIIAHLIQRESGDFFDKIKKCCNKIKGAFSFIIVREGSVYCIRDKNGFRPLSIAKLHNGYVVSSETCAFDIVNADYIRDIKAGEIVEITNCGLKTDFYTKSAKPTLCSMEYIYFSRPDSQLDGINVHTARRHTGQILARMEDVKADIVVGVPDSSLSAAIGFAEEINVPYEMGLIKNRYVGRTFIQPTQELREQGVRMKLSPVKGVVEGKVVILIDDSIVRGTTSKRIVSMLREAGAKEVHVRIGSPIMKNPCFYGVDTSRENELIGNKLDVENVKNYIGADSLKFLSCEQLQTGIKNDNLCMACFDGRYPTDLFSFGGKKI